MHLPAIHQHTPQAGMGPPANRLAESLSLFGFFCFHLAFSAFA